MSEYRVPNREKQIIQSNDGDYNGNLYATFNIDLDSNPGVIKPSRKLTRTVDSALDIWSGGSIFQALVIFDGHYYAVNNDDAIRCSVNSDPTNILNWSVVSGWGAEDLGLETDIASFDGKLLTSLGTDIMSWASSTKDDDWWTVTVSGTALTSAKPHIMEVLRSGKDTLFVTDGNKVRYYNSTAGHTTITLDTLMTAGCLTPSLDRMWAGTYTEVENNAFVYELQVGDSAATQAYEVDGRVCLTMFTYQNRPYVITERGYIQSFNGYGFTTIAQFPWANESKVMEGCRPGNVQDPSTSRAIHPKGAKVKGKYVYINVNADDEFISSDVTLSPRGASGVWVLDLETNSLTHRYAMCDNVSTLGTHKVSNSGPLLITNTPDTRIMVCSYVNGEEGIWMESDEATQGYFITTRHEAGSVADAFETVVVKADKLDSGQSIAVKYRDVSYSNMPLEVTDITWLDGTHFTTTNALTNVAVGDEVEINAGVAGGMNVHITAIEGETTKTVTVDTDTSATLNDLSDVYITSFKPISTTMTDDDGEYKKLGASVTAPSRQYKVVMSGDVTLREVISKSNNKQEL